MIIGKNSEINTGKIIYGNNCVIGDNVTINVRGTFKLGDCCIIKDNCTISCQTFTAGDYLYMGKNVEVGRGGHKNPDATVEIGNYVGIFENTIINPNSPVKIGDNVGIGDGVMIWTHGAWLDILEGFPADFGPVTIEKNVWLPARCIVLPNTTIGENTVIGIGSIITKDIPANVLAAGVPCKVIKHNMYPKKVLLPKERTELLKPILKRWYDVLCPAKSINSVQFLGYNPLKNRIELGLPESIIIYDLDEMKIYGEQNSVTEDLRDFLRRNGIKFYTGKLFRSMPNI